MWPGPLSFPTSAGIAAFGPLARAAVDLASRLLEQGRTELLVVLIDPQCALIESDDPVYLEARFAAAIGVEPASLGYPAIGMMTDWPFIC